MLYETELQAALQTVAQARPFILEAYAPFQPIPDAAASIHLPVDRQTQEILLHDLSSAFPQDAFCAEEETPTLAQLAARKTVGPRMWIIDPIDGTRGFAVKNGEFSVMVALLDQDQLALGVVYEPVRDRLTYAVRSGGCWRRDGSGEAERCQVSDRAQLAGATVTVTRSSAGPKVPAVVAALGEVRLRPSYSAGLKLTLVAHGEADLYLNHYLNFNDWDIAAGQILVEEAGGKVCDLKGRAIVYGLGRGTQRHGLLATNGHLQGAALAAIAGSP